MKKALMPGLMPLARHWWHFKTTSEGKVLAVSIWVAGGGAMLSLDIPVFQLAAGLGMFAAGVVVLTLLVRPRVEVTGRFPEKAVAGQAVTGRFTLTNCSGFAGYDLALAALKLPPSLVASIEDSGLGYLPAGGSSTATLTLEPLKRGLYPLEPFRAYTTFPFHLVRAPVRTPRHQGPVHSGSLLVYPQFHPLADIDVPISARYQPGGIALSSHVGESPEYIGNREYRPGDSTRHLDHRSWARLAMPVVREFQEEYYCRVALVLDTFVPGIRKSGPSGFRELEAAVSLSAAVADALARGEYIIDIFAAGPELHVFRAGRHTAHFESVLEILACVDACRANPFERVTPALTDELARISSVICVLLDWDEDRQQLVRAAVEAGCSVKVVIVRDSASTVPWEGVGVAGSFAQYSPEAVESGRIEVL